MRQQSRRRDEGSSEEGSAQRLALAARAAQLGIWDWNLDDNSFVYSQRAREIYGFRPDQPVTFEDVRDATHPDDLPFTLAQAERAFNPEIRDEEPYRYRIIRADDGALRWLLAYGEVVFDDKEGRPRAVRYTGTIQDITEQKLAENRIAESEARLKLAVAAADIAVWELDLRTETFAPSPDLNRLCGFAADARPTLDDLRARFAPGERERVERLAASVRARGERQIETEFRLIWPDGTEKWLLMRAQFAPGAEDQRVIGVLMDITDRKQAEERFREMADNAPVMIWVTDLADQCTFMSRSWYRFTGQAPGGALGRGWLACLHPDDRAAADRASRLSTREQRAFEAEYRLQHSDGGWRWVIDTATPWLGKSGEFLGHIGSIIDITERKLDEQRRKLLIRELHHRIKNNLAIVQALVAQSLKGLEGDKEAVAKLIGRLRALADAHEAVARDDWQSASLTSVIEQALLPFGSEAHHAIATDGPDLVIAARPAVALALGLHELATNAAKYGALSVEAGSVDLTWRILADADRLEILWQEKGGPAVAAPLQKGFGSRLIERWVSADLAADVAVEFLPDGVRCHILAPLAAIKPVL